MPSRPDEFSTVVAELTSLVDRLRTTLRSALESVLPSLDGARAFGRALGLKRVLGWKIYTVATSDDMPDVLKALPRRPGWNLLLERLERAGCPDARLDQLSTAIDALLARLDGSRIDRPLLRAIAEGRLDNAREATAVVRARRAVREGFEHIYGIRCDAQVAAYVIGPPDRTGHVDLVGILQFEGLRRLRPGPPFPLARLPKSWHPEWKDLRHARPLGAAAASGWLVPDLSTPDIWPQNLGLSEDPTGPTIDFRGAARVPNDPVRAVFASLIAKGGTVGQRDDRVDLHVGISIPTVRCAFEVWVHESIALLSEPAPTLVGAIDSFTQPSSTSDQIHLPLEAEVARIESPTLPAAFRTAVRPHGTIVRRAMSVAGGKPGEYRGFRLVVPDPPIGSRVSLRWRM